MSSLISIVVPVYNASKTIERCIESVLSQTYSQFELIIIDDGSTDDSLAICEKIAMSDSRIIVRHQENKGVSAARNLGISLCNGEWISFVDSDDYLGERFLHDLISDSSDCELIVGGYIKKYVKTNQEVKGVQFPNKYIEMGDDCMPIWDEVLLYGTPWGKLFKSDIIKTYNISFPIDYSLHEDHIFNFVFLLYASRIKLSDRNGYFYVNNGTATLSRNASFDPDLKWNAFILLSDKFEEIIRKLNLKSDCLPLTQNFIIRLYISAVVNSYKRKVFNSEFFVPSRELRERIRSFHKPTSSKGYVLKFVLAYLPSWLQCFILKLLIR